MDPAYNFILKNIKILIGTYDSLGRKPYEELKIRIIWGKLLIMYGGLRSKSQYGCSKLMNLRILMQIVFETGVMFVEWGL